jgi:hypothetical protein
VSKLPLTLKSTAAVSKVDATPWSRELWKTAYGMARRMIRDRATHGTGAALTWYLDHGFRRFGYAAMPIVRAAGWAVFNQLHVTKAATGTAEELARQGVLTRCVRLEPAPRGGWSWAWTHDPLAAVNLNRSYRVYRARQLREERRQVLAELEAEERLYVLTDLGRAALVAAGMATDRVALTPRGSRSLT